jgi:23S rRNA pseudouridine2457 synthase
VLIAFNNRSGSSASSVREAGRRTLADHVDVRGVYPAGRLDTDSEGLLLLTDDGALQRGSRTRGTSSRRSIGRSRERATEDALATLRRGVDLGDFVTRPADGASDRRARESLAARSADPVPREDHRPPGSSSRCAKARTGKCGA